MFNLSVQKGRDYLLIVVSGEGWMSPLCSSAKFVEDLLHRTQARRVLLDMMALTPMVSVEERKVVLSQLLEPMARLERLAIVIPPAISLGLTMEAARSRGVAAQEFEDLHIAEGWLRA